MLPSEPYRIDPLCPLHRLATSPSHFYFTATPYVSFARSTAGHPSCFAYSYKQKRDFGAELSSKSVHITPKPLRSNFHTTSRAE